MNPLLMGGLMQTERKLYIDVLRSIAILFMIEVHTSAQLAPSNIAKDSFLAIIVASIGGLAAPLFVTISGWGTQFSLNKKRFKSESENSILKWVIIRFSFLMIRRPPRSTLSSSSAASDVYKRQELWRLPLSTFNAKASSL